MIELESRILFNDGTTIVSEETALQVLLRSGELPRGMCVVHSDDAKKYEDKFGTKIIFDGDQARADELVYNPTFDKEYFDEICNNVREFKRNDIPDDIHHSRLDLELSYIIENNHQRFICDINKMILSFIEKKVVWGCGRGSCVASYLLYIMRVHDVDCITHDINPQEFFKNI